MTRPYRVNPEILARRRALAEEYYALYSSGWLLEDIGRKYGLTRERIRQVMTKDLGVKSRDGGQHLRKVMAAARRLAIRDQRYIDKYGYPFAEYWAMPKKARLAYSAQRKNAASRGIAWEFNFRQWWELWIASGKWELRGRGHGYCMCRNGDEGPYAPGNVFIAPARLNSSEQKRKTSGLPIGVTRRGRRFVAAYGVHGKRIEIGSFPTIEAAQIAYLTAVSGLSRVAA